MNKPDDKKIERQRQGQRTGTDLKGAEGEPFVVPEADARPEPDATPPEYHPVRAVPDEPLPPED
ncbi:hypothetical protein ACNTMW_01925 [Planosporangium sp. 12N6]|uniref:hypothetical protein n=1 Tax=Planosporangium spinosum TaxID=3402278 RepID=UPI003CE71CA8